jgi:golgi SNAP receptor complex member 1
LFASEHTIPPHSNMAAQTTWAQVRQQARAQETQTETLFHTYSQFASKSDLTPKPSDDELRLENQLTIVLETRSNLLQQLARLLDSEPTPPSALKSTNLARHREILTQHRTEFSRLKSQIKEARDRANLLSNVRSDVNAYRARENPEQAEADYMLDERARLDRSHTMVDSVLSQAYATNESFALQRESLTSIQRRITGAAAQIPGINSLMQRIGSKKRRDGIILGTFIAICMLALLWFW